MNKDIKNKLIKYLKSTRKELDECVENDSEYTTECGNGVNGCEASMMFAGIETSIYNILGVKNGQKD